MSHDSETMAIIDRSGFLAWLGAKAELRTETIRSVRDLRALVDRICGRDASVLKDWADEARSALRRVDDGLRRERQARLREQRKAAERRRMEQRGSREATLETRQKLKRGTIEALRRCGRLEAPHELAADEIERIWVALVGRLLSQRQAFERIDGHGDYGLAFIPAALRTIYVKRYAPWRDDMAAIRRLAGLPLHEIVIDVIIDGAQARDLDRAHAWRNGKAAALLVDALDHYAWHAGLVSEPALGRESVTAALRKRRTAA